MSFERDGSETEAADSEEAGADAEADAEAKPVSAFGTDWATLSLVPAAAATCDACKGMACNDMDRECADRADSGARKTGCVRGGPNWN